jgi:Protein of unknown function (DUF3712)
LALGTQLFVTDTLYAGINSFGHETTLTNVSIIGSGGKNGNQYILTDLTTTLQNPSNVSIQTNDVSFAIFFKDVKIGRAAINVRSFIYMMLGKS